MKSLKSLELEWKLLLIAGLVFTAFYVPVQSLFEKRIYQTIINSSDPVLEDHLRKQVAESTGEDREKAVELLERQLQWKASAPLVIREQNAQFHHFALTLLVVLLATAFLSFSRLTRPLRKLAVAVEKIGRGEPAQIDCGSGGSLGVLETKVNDLQTELAVLRQESQVQGMERAWRDIARVMAHEIKNPLTPMRLSVDRIDEKIAMETELSTEDLRRFTERLNRQLDTLELLVNRFRSFSREPEAQCEPVDLIEMINETGGDMAGAIKTECTGSAIVAADRILMKQVLLNLYKNSVNAGANTMFVTITHEKDSVKIRLRDNGRGITSDKLGTIFLPYVTFSEGGSGIGLSVVKNLIAAMHGTVSATSSPNNGFAVEIVLKAG